MKLTFVKILFCVIQIWPSDCNKPDDNSKKDESNSTDWRQLFREHGIQPDVIRRIPTDRLEVLTQSDGSRIETGSTISLKDINEMPKFRWKSDPKKLYSLFMLNPDVPSRREAYEAEWQHMTVVNIPGDSVEKGDAIIEYSPKYEHDQAAGVQRVVALVYEQKEKIDTSAMVKFDKDTLRNENGENRGNFHIKPFIYKAKLNDAGSDAGDFFYISVPKKSKTTHPSNRAEHLPSSETKIGIMGAPCQSKDDCQTKYLCVNQTCQVKAYHMPVVTRSLSKSAEKEKEKEKKKEKESSESGKVKSKEGGEVEDGEHENDEHNESDKADGQNYEETEEKKESKKITMCAENSECPSGQICKDNHCVNECEVNDDCKRENQKCVNNKCVEGDATLDKVAAEETKNDKEKSKETEKVMEEKRGSNEKQADDESKAEREKVNKEEKGKKEEKHKATEEKEQKEEKHKDKHNGNEPPEKKDEIHKESEGNKQTEWKDKDNEHTEKKDDKQLGNDVNAHKEEKEEKHKNNEMTEKKEEKHKEKWQKEEEHKDNEVNRQKEEMNKGNEGNKQIEGKGNNNEQEKKDDDQNKGNVEKGETEGKHTDNEHTEKKEDQHKNNKHTETKGNEKKEETHSEDKQTEKENEHKEDDTHKETVEKKEETHKRNEDTENKEDKGKEKTEKKDTSREQKKKVKHKEVKKKESKESKEKDQAKTSEVEDEITEQMDQDESDPDATSKEAGEEDYEDEQAEGTVEIPEINPYKGGQQKVKLVTSFSIPLSNDANLTVNAPESNPMAINANTGQALNAIMITVSTTTTTSSTTTTTRASSNTTERELQVKEVFKIEPDGSKAPEQDENHGKEEEEVEETDDGDKEKENKEGEDKEEEEGKGEEKVKEESEQDKKKEEVKKEAEVTKEKEEVKKEAEVTKEKEEKEKGEVVKQRKKANKKSNERVDDGHYEATLDPKELDTDDGTDKVSTPDDQYDDKTKKDSKETKSKNEKEEEHEHEQVEEETPIKEEEKETESGDVGHESSKERDKENKSEDPPSEGEKDKKEENPSLEGEEDKKEENPSIEGEKEKKNVVDPSLETKKDNNKAEEPSFESQNTPRSSRRNSTIKVAPDEADTPSDGYKKSPGKILGYYKYPKNCDHLTLGSCHYKVSWFKESKTNEISFAIEVKGADSTSLGFSQNKMFPGSDVIYANAFGVEDKHINAKNEVILDEARNLIDTHVEKRRNVLIVNFVRQIQTDDALYDVDIGKPGGVFFFFDGSAISRRNSFVFMPKRIDLSPYFDKEFRRKELELFAKLPEGLSPLEERLPPDQEYLYKNVCRQRSNDGRRFISSRLSFTSYVVCSGGNVRVRGCPSNSIFYVVLQCCVPAFKFPCRKNCVHDHTDVASVDSEFAQYYLDL